MNIDVIKKQKEVLGYTNEYLAAASGVTVATLYKWFNGSVKRVPEDKLERLAKTLELSVDALRSEKRYLVKPILGTVRAGYNLFAEESLLGFEEVSEKESSKGDYYLQVDGDSMIGERIFSGDLVYVKQTNVVNEDDVAVVLVGDEVTIKKVKFKDSLMILEAANPEVANRYFNESEVRLLPVQIIGKVVHSKRSF